MIYDAIEGGMASITIIFKVGNEIHQPLLFGQQLSVKTRQGIAPCRCRICC
jgi:hypothetical protein